MSEKKVVGRNIAIALGILSVLLVAALIGTVAYYYMFNENNAQQPYLLNVGVYGTDGGAANPVFHINGFLANAGTETAYNVKLHVVCYTTTNAKAIDTYIQVGSGTIPGRDSAQLGIDVPYSYSGVLLQPGSATITPIWTNKP
jgi:hypothetical protein